MKCANLLSDIKVILRGYSTASKFCPWYMTLNVIRGIFNALAPFVNILMSGFIINAIINKRSLQTLLLLVLLTIAANFIVGFFNNLTSRWASNMSINFNRMFNDSIHRKIMYLDYEDAENQDVQKMRERIRFYQDRGGGLRRLVMILQELLNGIFTVVFSLVVVVGALVSHRTASDGSFNFVLSPYCSIAILVLIAINVVFSIYVNSRSTKEWYGFREEYAEKSHFYNEYLNRMKNYEFGKDIRIYRQKSIILNEGLMKMEGEFVKIAVKREKLMAKYNNLLEISSNISAIGIYLFVVLRALAGLYSIGNIVQIVGSINQFNRGFTQFSTTLVSIYNNLEPVKLYFQFMDMSNKIHHGVLPIERCNDKEYQIEFHNVSFKYPYSENYVLKNLSFKIQNGQRIAVVGMNGSGKTTMIKLLCCLYNPSEGKITLNGVDIKEYDYKQYIELFGIIFQDYKLFSFPLGQNVAADINYEKEKAIEALSKSGLSERMKTMDLETALYKNFDINGVEISGGEAQKIVLARALYKDAPIIILDEPTAALDPVAEFEVFYNFNEIVGNKTAIYISHRLSSCRFCDDILVFHNGELIQKGNHDALITDKTGKYYELWNAQAQYYIEHNNDILRYL